MRKIILPIQIIILLFFAFLISGCFNKENKPNTFIQGEILYSTNNQLILSSYNSFDTTYLQLNKFKFEFYLEAPAYFTLRNKSNSIRIFLNPNDTLNLQSLSKNTFDSITFNGSASDANNYLLTKQKHLKKHSTTLQELYSKPPQFFLITIDSIYLSRVQFLDSILQNVTVNKNPFIEFEKKALLYEKAKLLIEYPLLSPYAYKIDNDKYFSFIKELTLNDTTLLFIFEYSEFISSYVEWLTFKETNGRTDFFQHDISLIKMQVISRNFATGKIKDNLLYNTLNDHIRFYGLKNTQHLFKTFEFQCNNNLLKEKLLKPYKQYLSLNNGGKAPSFEVLNLNGETLNLNSLKGNYLYIDVWATWCKPCIKEAPYFEDLKNEYKNKNIEFISISVDDKKEKWESYCKKNKKQENYYWIANKKEFLDSYTIKTIPHFIIINEEGNIVNINAQRPSENKNDWLNDLPNK